LKKLLLIFMVSAGFCTEIFNLHIVDPSLAEVFEKLNLISTVTVDGDTIKVTDISGKSYTREEAVKSLISGRWRTDGLVYYPNELYTGKSRYYFYLDLQNIFKMSDKEVVTMILKNQDNSPGAEKYLKYLRRKK